MVRLGRSPRLAISESDCAASSTLTVPEILSAAPGPHESRCDPMYTYSFGYVLPRRNPSVLWICFVPAVASSVVTSTRTRTGPGPT